MTAAVKRARGSRGRRALHKGLPEAIISPHQLAALGGGEVAYIKHMEPGQAKKLFPAIKGLPAGIELFSLHAADGTPIAITDTWRACVEHARGDKLEIATVH